MSTTGTGASTYANDADGNTLTGGNRTNTWDSQNRMVSCAFNGTTTTNTYGAGGFGIFSPANDRAFLGWTNFVSLWPYPINDCTGFTATLFDNLARNYDLYTACVMSTASSPRIGWLGDDPYGADKFKTGALSPHIIGDGKMKLHGVYGDVVIGYIIKPDGSENPVINRAAWFKPM